MVRYLVLGWLVSLLGNYIIC